MTISERMFSLIDSRSDKTAAGLCKVLGVGTAQTTSWRQRNADPPAKYLAQICKYLDVSLDFLVTGEEAQDAPLLSKDEERLIEKYRDLDDDGKDVVRSAAIAEQRRVIAEKGTGNAKIG